MEELELYINNTIKNPEELKSYQYILMILNKVLKGYVVEMGGLDKDSNGNITKISNNIKIFIEKYDDITPNHFCELKIGSDNEKIVIFKVNSNELNKQNPNLEDKYINSPVRFYMDLSNKENGTISIQDCNLYYFDESAYNEYTSKTNDNNPSFVDYRKEQINSTSKLPLKDFSIEQICKNMYTLLQYGFDAPLVEEAINKNKDTITKVK